MKMTFLYGTKKIFMKLEKNMKIILKHIYRLKKGIETG